MVRRGALERCETGANPLETRGKRKPVTPENDPRETGLSFLNGGGGGSRTRVRRHSTRASTGLDQVLVWVQKGPLIRLFCTQPSWSFNRYAGRRTYLASLIRSSLSLAYQASAVRALAVLCSQGVIVVVGNYYFAACFTRPRGTSACNPCFIASVEAVAPPWSMKLMSKISSCGFLSASNSIRPICGLARGEGKIGSEGGT